MNGLWFIGKIALKTQSLSSKLIYLNRRNNVNANVFIHMVFVIVAFIFSAISQSLPTSHRSVK